MKVAVLSSATTHHAYYLWKLAGVGALSAVVLETGSLRPSFDTFHPFETERDAYEREVLLADFGGSIGDLAPVREVENVNDAVPFLRALAPDIVLVFGSGLLLPDTIATAPVCLNLHGGNPEEYRGLDSHLWAIYHRDFENLVTTLHHVDPRLDCGDIVDAASLPLAGGMRLHELRAANTRVCVDISLRALRDLESSGEVVRRPQRRRGRYYSFMPAVLKERCVAEFERHTAAL